MLPVGCIFYIENFRLFELELPFFLEAISLPISSFIDDGIAVRLYGVGWYIIYIIKQEFM